MRMHRHESGGRVGRCAAIGATLIAGVFGVAHGQTVADVNKPFEAIAPNLRSDRVILPALAKVAPPPASVSSLAKARLLTVGKAGWSEAAAWSVGATQKAALEALVKVTRERDWHKSYAFGQPYGVEGVEPDLVRERLYTELDEANTLAAARSLYLSAFDRLEILVNVEATRLAGEGKVNEALSLLLAMLYFERQIADRAFFREVRWALVSMQGTLERLRDVLYTDSRTGKPVVTEAAIMDLLVALDETTPTTSYLDLARIKWPMGDAIAARQAIALVTNRGTLIDQRAFAATMARIRTSEYPLRAFSESSRWSTLAAGQADPELQRKKIDAVVTDWSTRWPIPWFDRRMSLNWEYDQVNHDRYAPVVSALPNMTELFHQRHLASLEAVGTRTAAAMAATVMVRKSFPPDVTAVRPRYLRDVDADPYNPNRDMGAKPAPGYFIPAVVAAGGGREGRAGHEMEVVTGTGNNFRVLLKDDTFVMYSVGTDLADHKARRVQNTWKRVEGADYLIWPPMLSLERQNLIDVGAMK